MDACYLRLNFPLFFKQKYFIMHIFYSPAQQMAPTFHSPFIGILFLNYKNPLYGKDCPKMISVKRAILMIKG